VAYLGCEPEVQHPGIHYYWGWIYIDNTQARVLVADAPEFIDITHSEIQIPITWNNNNISFTCNNGGCTKFADDQELWYYVFDRDGNYNEIGVHVTCHDPIRRYHQTHQLQND
jgi:hypothetical protein